MKDTILKQAGLFDLTFAAGLNKYVKISMVTNCEAREWDYFTFMTPVRVS